MTRCFAFSRTSRLIGIFNHREPTYKGTSVIAKRPFTICSPKVMCGANRLLCTIVCIVTKRGTNLTLHLDSGDEAVVSDNKHVPKLGRSEKTGKRESGFVPVY